VLETTVEKVRYDEVKDTDGLQRVHMLRTETATVVDAELVEEHLERQKKRILEAKGIHELPLDPTRDPDADPLDVFGDEGLPADDGDSE
jgi:hypothetical protein